MARAEERGSLASFQILCLHCWVFLPSPSWDNLTLMGKALEDGNRWSVLPVSLKSSFREGKTQT